MKKEEEKKVNVNENLEEDNSELDIEELTDIQGGIEDWDIPTVPSCGLGCFQGSGSPDNE